MAQKQAYPVVQQSCQKNYFDPGPGLIASFLDLMSLNIDAVTRAVRADTQNGLPFHFVVLTSFASCWYMSNKTLIDRTAAFYHLNLLK